MAVKRQVSNADLYLRLGQIDEKVDAVHEQTKKTNGRVNNLERWRDAVLAVEQYREKELNKIAEDKGWTRREKQLIAFITTLMGIVAALIGARSL